jgi:hypothetical protein
VDSGEPPRVVIVADAGAAAPTDAPPAPPESATTPAPAPAPAPAPESAPPIAASLDLPLPPPHSQRPLEMGATTFLLAGVGTAGVLGLSAFLSDPLSADVVLRFALGGGEAFEGTLPTVWAGGRLDTCYMVTGNYAAGQGLFFGICGGVDVGATVLGGVDGRPGQTLPFVDLGPTAELGSEIGETVSLVLRAGVGFAITRDSFVDGAGDRIDPSPGTERAELGLSWKLR